VITLYVLFEFNPVNSTSNNSLLSVLFSKEATSLVKSSVLKIATFVILASVSLFDNVDVTLKDVVVVFVILVATLGSTSERIVVLVGVV
jgi:hypothetical protein